MTDPFVYRLRQSRAHPPGQAGEKRAAPLYRAAVRQFEDLLEAAVATKPAGRPLPLFYALSQVGRGIAAAHGEAGDHVGHGLTCPLQSETAPLLYARVKPKVVKPQEQLEVEPKVRTAQGQFQVVSSALNSPTFDQSIELGACLASLPDFAQEPVLAKWLPAVRVSPFDGSPLKTKDGGWAIGSYVDIKASELTIEAFQAQLDKYPMAAQAQATVLSIPPHSRVFSGKPAYPEAPHVAWPTAGLGYQGAAPPYRKEDYHWLRPGLTTTGETPTALMTWWLVLFTLSMIARYHPVAWVTALDPDKSPTATLLERVMEEGLSAVPQLAYEAVVGHPCLVAVPEI